MIKMYYRKNNVNDKNDNSNDHGQNYCFKEANLLYFTFDTICKGIQRESIRRLKNLDISLRISAGKPL